MMQRGNAVPIVGAQLAVPNWRVANRVEQNIVVLRGGDRVDLVVRARVLLTVGEQDQRLAPRCPSRKLFRHPRIDSVINRATAVPRVVRRDLRKGRVVLVVSLDTVNNRGGARGEVRGDTKVV